MAERERLLADAMLRVSGRLLLGLAALLMAANASAVNISMVYHNYGENPTYDPNGTQLQALMGAVETYWEDIMKCNSTWTLTVNYGYEDLTGSTLASHSNEDWWPFPDHPEECKIVVDSSDRTWYIDQTPFDNSEYTMSQTLYRGLSAANKTAYYNGTPPDVLEERYVGSANGSVPAAASEIDMFSVLLHEMGHGLGMTGNYASGETGDEDYDFASALVWGATAAARCYASDNVYHLAANTLMYPTIGDGVRRLPSATDVFAIQDGGDWSTTGIDLKRKDFYNASPSASWTTTGNWEGNRLPDSADDAFVRHGGTATLASNQSVASLLIDAASAVSLSSCTLTVGTATTIGQGSQSASVTVGSGGLLTSGSIAVANLATLSLDSGGDATAGSITVASGGTLQITNTSSSTGSVTATTALAIAGSVTADGTGCNLYGPTTLASTAQVSVADANDYLYLQGTTTFQGGSYTGLGMLRQCGNATVTAPTTIGVATYDMDGTSETTTFTLGSTLTLNVQAIDAAGTPNLAFGGTMNINSGGSLVVNTPAAWGINGTLNMAGGQVSGSALTLSGPVNIDTNNCNIYCNTTLASTAQVSLPDAEDYLYLHGATTFQGGSYTGLGVLRHYGNATVTAPTTISVSYYDMDGISTTTAVFTLGSIFTLNVQSIESPGVANEFNDTLNINSGGELVVNTPTSWTMAGTLNLADGKVSGTAPLVIARNVNTDGANCNIYADTTFASTAQVSLPDAGDYLYLQGATTFQGGSYTGLGVLRHYGNATVTAPTTISVSYYDMDGISTTTAVFTLGSIFTLNVQSIESPGVANEFNDTLNINSGGELVVNTPTSWTMAGTLNLAGGRVKGQAFVQSGALATTTSTGYLDAAVTFDADSTNSLSTNLQLGAASYVMAGAAFSGAGDLRVASTATLAAQNNAAVNVDVVNLGRVSPGVADGAGGLTFGGTLTTSGTLDMELGGPARGTQYDWIRTNGLATLGGTLDVSFLAGYAPFMDAVFDLFDFLGGRSGSFASILTPAGFTFDLSQLYVDGTIRVTNVPGLIPGDASGDYAVNETDAAILASYWGSNSATWTMGDFNRDGRVNAIDAAILTANWGVHAESSAVPEPAMSALLAGLALSLVLRRRRATDTVPT